MLNNRLVSANKHDPTGPVRAIVSKSVTNLRSIPIRQKLSMTNSHDRLRQIAVVAYHAVQRGFEDGYEVTGLVRGRNRDK